METNAERERKKREIERAKEKTIYRYNKKGVIYIPLLKQQKAFRGI